MSLFISYFNFLMIAWSLQINFQKHHYHQTNIKKADEEIIFICYVESFKSIINLSFCKDLKINKLRKLFY